MRESWFSLILVLNPGGEFGVNLSRRTLVLGASSERPLARGKFSCESFDVEVHEGSGADHSLTILQFCQAARSLRGAREWLARQCVAFFLYNEKHVC